MNIIPSVSRARPASMVWKQLPDLPDLLGLKGMYAGRSRGRVILAGGSNFPISPREGGRRNLSRQIFLRGAGEEAHLWVVSKSILTDSLAEGVSLTAGNDMICMGGLNAHGHTTSVFALEWDIAIGEVLFHSLPDIPAPRANAAAAFLNGYLYLAGGDVRGQAGSSFWLLDLGRAKFDRRDARWQELPTWPGPFRFGAVLTVLELHGREQLLLFGGRTDGDSTGQVQLSEYLTDGFCYDPQVGRLRKLGDMPDRALRPGAIRIGRSRLAILGGSNGHSLERMTQLGSAYRMPTRVIEFDAETERWNWGGNMPIGVVAPALVDEGRTWVLAGGEYPSGLRTARISRHNRRRWAEWGRRMKFDGYCGFHVARETTDFKSDHDFS